VLERVDGGDADVRVVDEEAVHPGVRFRTVMRPEPPWKNTRWGHVWRIV
jgi:hypothetical protein